MASLKTPIRDETEIGNPNVVKVVTGADGCALYFSRSPLPYWRGGGAGGTRSATVTSDSTRTGATFLLTLRAASRRRPRTGREARAIARPRVRAIRIKVTVRRWPRLTRAIVEVTRRDAISNGRRGAAVVATTNGRANG